MPEGADAKNQSEFTGTASTWPANEPGPANESGDLAGTSARLRKSDEAAGFELNADFVQFSQRNDIFNRAQWDDSVKSPHTKAFFRSQMDPKPRTGDGFTLWDFALSNASWTVAHDYAARGRAKGLREGFQDPFQVAMPVSAEKVVLPAKDELTARIKRAVKFFGGDIVGITEYDERWLYSYAADAGSRTCDDKPNQDFTGMKSVIVIGHAMDYDLVRSYPSALASAATGREYSHEAAIVNMVAAFIRGIGFNAVGTSNDTALTIPYAIKAGLGEYGRNQMVITEEFGSRIRFSKIFTDLELAFDQPKRFGVREYCDQCTVCADACPPKALPFGPPAFTTLNRSTVKGVKKWSADCEKCFGFWPKMKIDCAICMRVCPYNRDYTKPLSRMMRRLMGSPLRGVARWLNRKLDHGNRIAPKEWWAQGTK